MRKGVWVGTIGLAGAAALGLFLSVQPSAQAGDEMQDAAIACQRSLDEWNALSAGTPAPSRAVARTALDAATRCGHQPTLEDRRLAGEA